MKRLLSLIICAAMLMSLAVTVSSEAMNMMGGCDQVIEVPKVDSKYVIKDGYIRKGEYEEVEISRDDPWSSDLLFAWEDSVEWIPLLDECAEFYRNVHFYFSWDEVNGLNIAVKAVLLEDPQNLCESPADDAMTNARGEAVPGDEFLFQFGMMASIVTEREYSSQFNDVIYRGISINTETGEHLIGHYGDHGYNDVCAADDYFVPGENYIVRVNGREVTYEISYPISAVVSKYHRNGNIPVDGTEIYANVAVTGGSTGTGHNGTKTYGISLGDGGYMASKWAGDHMNAATLVFKDGCDPLPHVHDFTAIETCPPTCDRDGYTLYTCECGETVEGDIVEALGHTMGKWTVIWSPNCTEPGWESRSCLVCDYWEERELEPEGHTFGAWEVSIPATCTTAGLKTRECIYHDGVETEEIPATGHSFSDWFEFTPPACYPDCTEARECTVCDKLEYKNMGTAKHSFGEWYETVAPTCFEDGMEAHDCPICGETESRVKPTPGHVFGEWFETIPATCTLNGEEARECTGCGEIEFRETDPLEHPYSEWEIKNPATCTRAGIKSRKCQSCGKTETSAILATGHTFGEWTETTPHTCTEAGEETRRCENCYETESREVAASHAFGEWTETSAPTCTEAGKETRKCENCSATESKALTALGHSFDEWIVDKEATDKTFGKKHRDCQSCDATESAEIPLTQSWIDEFTDLTAAWYKPYANFVVANGLMSGTGGGSFSPTVTMDRRMVVKVLHNMAGSPAPEGENPFTDLEANQKWYHDAVIWAAENGIVAGKGDGRFDPTGAVTRQELAVFLYRFANSEYGEKFGRDTEKTAELNFHDASSTASWATAAVKWAVAEGLISGKSQNGVLSLAPLASAMRAEVAVVFSKFCSQ